MFGKDFMTMKAVRHFLMNCLSLLTTKTSAEDKNILFLWINWGLIVALS